MHQPALRPERRRETREEMIRSVALAMDTLSKCLSLVDKGNTDAASGKVLEAFAAWLKLSGGGGLTGQLLLNSPLVSAAIHNLSSTEETFYAATDAVIELIYCSSIAGHPKEDMIQLVQMMVSQIIALRPRFHVCMQQALSSAEHGGSSDVGGLSMQPFTVPVVGAGVAAATTDGTTDVLASSIMDYEEDAKAIARLFAEVGEAYTDLIATGTLEAMLPVDALLDVASHPDDAICAISFNFWHRLSCILTQELRPRPLFADDDEQHSVLSRDQSLSRLSLFAPAFERLIFVVRGRVRFPEDFDQWHVVEREEFRHARVMVGDVLGDAAGVLGSSATLRLLVEPLIELSARIQAAHTSDGGLAELEAREWRTAEAALYCIRCVHRYMPPAGDPLLMSLFAALPNLMPNQPKLVYTVALTVSSYSDWLAECCYHDDRSGDDPEGERRAAEGIALVGALVTMLIRGMLCRLNFLYFFSSYTPHAAAVASTTRSWCFILLSQG